MYCGNCFREIRGKTVCPFCGFDTAAAEGKYPVALKTGSILHGRYIIGRVLGQGGFGITYLAQDDRTKKLVAIKEYYPTEFAARAYTSCAVDPVSADRQENFEFGKQKFLEEAKTLSAFLGNEHIVRIRNYFEENGTAYFTMEYVDGQPLDKYMAAQGGRLSVDEANALLLPLMGALEEVHAKGIVHRDIAPDNIIVQPNGVAKLIDFGAARYSTGEKSKSLDVVIKHGFAPYEQYMRRGRQGPFTDVYAMAATYYYAVTGKIPPDAIERNAGEELAAPRELGVDISEKTEKALFKALEVLAKDRFQTMGEFREAMRDPEAERRAREEAERRAAEAAEKARLEEERRRAEAERLAREEEERRAAEAAEKARIEEERRAAEAAEKARREEERRRAEAEKKAREEARLAAKAAEKERKERERRERLERKASAGANKKGPPKWIFAAIPAVLLAVILPIALKGTKNPVEPGQATETAVAESAETAEAAAANAQTAVENAAADTQSSSLAEQLGIPSAAAVGDTITFGHYEQDNDPANGKEPIEWLVLDRQDDRILVISKYALDCQPYNKKNEKVTWETCTLRNWLNNSFMNEAFATEEQDIIPAVTISADKNPYRNTDPGNDTTDRIFLLSVVEAERFFNSEETRLCEPSAFTTSKGAFTNGLGFCCWWLRSPGDGQSKAAFVTAAVGYVGHSYDVRSGDPAVRPALWIDVSAGTQTVKQPEPEKTAAALPTTTAVGDIITFGSYEQDNDLANGKEPIEWLVLDKQDSRILVISKYGLDCRSYNKEYKNVTWETCTLRSWLNDSFLNEAFSSEEQTLIPTVMVSADKNPKYGYDSGKDTNDQVFLLSIDEVNKYFSNDTVRKCEPTAYAMAQSAYKSDRGFCTWWLRSRGGGRSYAVRVDSNGSVDFGGVRVDLGGVDTVRPAMWIRIG